MSVVKPNVTELLDHAQSRYTLVVVASKRGRELIAQDKQPLVEMDGIKPLEVAVQEISRGFITYEEAPAADGIREA